MPTQVGAGGDTFAHIPQSRKKGGLEDRQWKNSVRGAVPEMAVPFTTSTCKMIPSVH